MTTYYFEGMLGLGDSIYQRPFLRHFPGAYVRTCWPELYRGLNVKCVRSGTHLRTQGEKRTPVALCLPSGTTRWRQKAHRIRPD